MAVGRKGNETPGMPATLQADNDLYRAKAEILNNGKEIGLVNKRTKMLFMTY